MNQPKLNKFNYINLKFSKFYLNLNQMDKQIVCTNFKSLTIHISRNRTRKARWREKRASQE